MEGHLLTFVELHICLKSDKIIRHFTRNFSVRHAVGFDMPSTTIQTAHCRVSVVTFSVFYYVADSVICSSTMQKESHCCVIVPTMVTQAHHNFAPYVQCLYNFNNIVERFL